MSRCGDCELKDCELSDVGSYECIERLNNRILDLEVALREAPIAGRPKGHWIDANGNIVSLNRNGFTKDSAWCSICGDWLTASDEYATRGWFCPNCGTDMRGGSDE